MSFWSKRQPFVQLLGDRHRALGAKAEFARGLLLERRRDERRRRVALHFFLAHIHHDIRAFFEDLF
jgi:hypothetical protein